MAVAYNHVRDLNDFALKPRLLRNLVKDQLPNETTSLQNPNDIAAVVSAVNTHQLLSEEVPTSYNADDKVVSSWKSAIDGWIEHNLLLSRSNSPEKSWAGVCLLGVTCTGCSPERFLSSFLDWFNVFTFQIQQPGVSEIVKVASFAAASDLLTRLGRFSNKKKDGISCSGKLVQPILKALNKDATEEMGEVAAQLLYTILTYFPSTLHRYYDNAEAAIVSKIMSGKCSSILLNKLACCLASLSKSKGDGESWSLMMQKILLSLSAHLDSGLEGLEEESRREKVLALLVLQGKDLPPPLGGQTIGEEAIDSSERSQDFVISIISCLMQCCSKMLTSSCEVQVVVPVRPILAIIERVLMANGSLPEALQPFTTAMQQDLVCLHLPIVHQNVLELLTALQKGLHSQVLPHAAEIVWLLTKYFEQCWLPELRTKAYTVIKSLLISMGAGMALYISHVVIDNGMIDLKVANQGYDKELPTEVSVNPSPRNHRKRRKHGSGSGPSAKNQASVNSELKEPHEHQASISLKIAAIEALEALVTVGGSLRSDSWRSGIDHLLIEVATNACEGGSNHVGKPTILEESGTSSEDFQLVALRALLVSLLSQADVRPPYLAQGLELFLKGKLNGGTKVTEFCAQALLALEVLIHPRALPLVDVPLQTGNNFSSGRMDKLPSFSKTVNGIYPDVYDVQDYLNNEDAFGSEVLDISKHTVTNAVDGVDCLSEKLGPKDREEVSEPASIEDKIEVSEDLVMQDVPPQTVSCRSDSFVSPGGLSSGLDLANDAPLVPAFTTAASTAGVESAAPSKSSDYTRKRRLEEDDDDDSCPDIVDADPDTDSDSDY